MKLDNIGKSYVDMMFSSSIEQHITLPTRIAGNSVKLSHHPWTNCSSTAHSGVLDAGIRDNYTTFAFIPSCIERKLTNEKVRDRSETCLEALK